MSELSVKHLLGIKHLTEADIQLIFDTATQFKEVINRPIKKVPSLRDITIANLFFENSTRTKLSFELAQKRLSADVINFASSLSSLKKGETLIDTVNNILSMKVDIVVVRHSSPGAASFLAKHVDATIINAGDGAHEHPTQAILDAYSLRERLGSLEGKNILIVGDILHSRVALSNIFCLQKLGANVAVCGPATLIPKHIEQLGAIHQPCAVDEVVWDEDNQIFWSKKPYPSWVKHIATASWKSPIGDAPDLSDEKKSQNEAGTNIWNYVWNEDNQTWDLTDLKT